MITFTISEPPFGRQQPPRGAYTAPKTRAYQKRVRAACEDVMRRNRLGIMRGALEMRLTAYYPIPVATSKKKRALMMLTKIRPTVKPDADNVAKAIADAIKGVALVDDAQIVTLVVQKFYDPTPRVLVILEKAGDEEEGVQDRGPQSGLRSGPETLSAYIPTWSAAD